MYEWYVVLACIVYFLLYLCIAILHTKHNRMHQYRNEDDYYVIHDENGEIHLVWMDEQKNETHTKTE